MATWKVGAKLPFNIIIPWRFKTCGCTVLLQFAGILCWKIKYTQTLMECIADIVKMGGKFGAFWELSGDLLHPFRKYLSMGPGSLWSVLSGEKSWNPCVFWAAVATSMGTSRPLQPRTVLGEWPTEAALAWDLHPNMKGAGDPFSHHRCKDCLTQKGRGLWGNF